MNQQNQEIRYDAVVPLIEGHKVAPKPAKAKSSKDRFGLTWSNGLLFALLSIGISVLFVFTEDKTVASLGRFCATIAFLAIAPLIFSFVTWLFFESKAISSISFHVVAILIFVGLLTPSHRARNPAEGGPYTGAGDQKKAQLEAGRQLAENKDLLRKNLSATDDPEAANKAVETYSSKTQELLGKYAGASTGTEKKALEISRDFMIENDRLIKNWRNSMASYDDPRILDYDRLKTKEEFDHQKKVVQTYITEAEGFLKRSQGAVSELTKRLNAIGPNDPYVKNAIRKVARNYERQKPFFEPMMERHLSRGRTSLELLNLLEKEQGNWTVKNGDLTIEDAPLFKKVNSMLESLQNDQEAINKYFDELIKAP